MKPIKIPSLIAPLYYATLFACAHTPAQTHRQPSLSAALPVTSLSPDARAVRVRVGNAAVARKNLAGRRGEVRVEDNWLYLPESYMGYLGPVEPRHRAASFIVDYDAPEVQALRPAIEKLFGSTPSINDLQGFVAEYVEGDYGRGFDFASRVAKQKTGDCSEMAMLLTALARAYGFAAQVVFGFVMVEKNQNINAVGHAWVEYFADERWQVADAALDNEDGEVAYYPMGHIVDEGPSFMRFIAGVMQHGLAAEIVLH